MAMIMKDDVAKILNLTVDNIWDVLWDIHPDVAQAIVAFEPTKEDLERAIAYLAEGSPEDSFPQMSPLSWRIYEVLAAQLSRLQWDLDARTAEAIGRLAPTLEELEQAAHWLDGSSEERTRRSSSSLLTIISICELVCFGKRESSRA